jgi:hypothetical protein
LQLSEAEQPSPASQQALVSQASQHTPASQQGPLQAQGPPASQAQPAATHSQLSQRQTSQQSQGEVAEATGTAPSDAKTAGRASANMAQRTANFFMEILRTENKANGRTRGRALSETVNSSSSTGRPVAGCRRRASTQRDGCWCLQGPLPRGLHWRKDRAGHRQPISVQVAAQRSAGLWRHSTRRSLPEGSDRSRRGTWANRVWSGSRRWLFATWRVSGCSRPEQVTGIGRLWRPASD